MKVEKKLRVQQSFKGDRRNPDDAFYVFTQTKSTNAYKTLQCLGSVGV